LLGGFFAALVGMIVGHLILIEIGKRIFHGAAASPAPTRRRYGRHRHLCRRATHFSTATRQLRELSP
jgi:Mg2+-importing ATPase